MPRSDVYTFRVPYESVGEWEAFIECLRRRGVPLSRLIRCGVDELTARFFNEPGCGRVKIIALDCAYEVTRRGETDEVEGDGAVQDADAAREG